MLKMRKTMVSWQAFPSLLPRAPLSFLARLKLPFPKLPFPKLPFPSLSNAFPFKRLPRRLKNFENRQKHQRRRSAWVGQADFGKLELTIGITAVTVSACHERDPLETRSI